MLAEKERAMQVMIEQRSSECEKLITEMEEKYQENDLNKEK